MAARLLEVVAVRRARIRVPSRPGRHRSVAGAGDAGERAGIVRRVKRASVDVIPQKFHRGGRVQRRTHIEEYRRDVGINWVGNPHHFTLRLTEIGLMSPDRFWPAGKHGRIVRVGIDISIWIVFRIPVETETGPVTIVNNLGQKHQRVRARQRRYDLSDNLGTIKEVQSADAFVVALLVRRRSIERRSDCHDRVESRPAEV
jgi:hypothetical protein